MTYFTKQTLCGKIVMEKILWEYIQKQHGLKYFI